LVHRWVQMAAESRIDLRAELDGAISTAGERWLREMGVADTAIDAILARVRKALQGMIDDERGRWLIEGEGYAELALTGVIDGRIELPV